MIETDRHGFPFEVDTLDADTVLALASDIDTQIRVAERARLNLVARWCDLHPARTTGSEPGPGYASWGETGEILECDEPLGGDGCPLVAAFCAEDLAAAFAMSPAAAVRLLADVLNLVHRLKRTWHRVQALQVPGWRARRLAQATATLSLDAARYVDAQLAGRIDSVGVVTIDRVVAEATARFDPQAQAAREDEARKSWHVRLSHGAVGDWAGTSWLDATGDTGDLTRFHDLVCATAEALRLAGDTDDLEIRKAKALGVITDQLTGQSRNTGAPGSAAGPGGATSTGRRRRGRDWTVYVHLDWDQLQTAIDQTAIDQTATNETPTAQAGVGTVHKLGPATVARIRDWLTGAAHVSIRPVLDLARTDAVDAHDPPQWMRELVVLRDPHCVFPGCRVASEGCDLDHIEPYDPGTPEDPGPPGQTSPDTLAPLCRRHHRCKTAGRWRYRRNPDGTYTWQTPHGRAYLVTETGTLELRG